MSVCPPYAPFFGFAGVASAVRFLLRLLCHSAYETDPNVYVDRRWSLAVRIHPASNHFACVEGVQTHVGIVSVGAAFGTAKSGIGIAGLGTFKPELIMKVRMGTSYPNILHLTLPLFARVL